MQCVSSIQVKAPDLTQKGQHTQNKGSPQFRGMRWEGMSVPMSHQGCHSGVQVFWQSKFSSRRAQRRFLVWVPESQRAVRGNPVWASSASLSSLDACLLSLALLRCLSTPFAAVSLKSSLWKCGCYYYACVQVCFPQCMCASPSSVLRGRQRTSALNSPLTPPPPPSLRPSSPPPSLPPSPLSADINTQGTCAKIPGKVVRILGGHWTERERVKRQQTVLSVEFTRSKVPPSVTTCCCRCMYIWVT